MNPMQQADDERRATLQHLREENERLMRELEGANALGAGGASVSATPAPSHSLAHATAQTTAPATPAAAAVTAALEKRLFDSEKKIQRLKEVFGEKILEFREVCYSLTGYQIEMAADNRYVLRSMFADRETDTLAFTRDRATGAVAMLETDFSRSVRRTLEPLLRMRNSIPAITATLTLELFARQTSA